MLGVSKAASRRVLVSSVGLLGLAFAAASRAAITVDGTLDSGYGSALSTQTLGTQFGTTTTATPAAASGSELDAAYGVVQGGTLYLFFSGDLENNYNKLDVFIQASAGGQNQLTTPSTGGQGTFDRLAGDGTSPGLKFDAGFAPTRQFVFGTGANTLYVNTANLVTNTSGYAGSLSSDGTTPFAGTPGGGDASTPASLNVALNDSNLSNSDGSPKPGATTGLEFSVSLADLGYTGGNLTVQGFINSNDNNFISNQSLGSLPSGTGNLGEPRTTDFSSIAGAQTFTVAVPEPASLGLLGLAAVAGLRRKSR